MTALGPGAKGWPAFLAAAAVLLPALLSGCADGPPSASSPQDAEAGPAASEPAQAKPDGAVPAGGEWTLAGQATLNVFVGAAGPGFQAVSQTPGYCLRAAFDVPAGATVLDLTMTPPAVAGQGGAGALVLTAAGPGGEYGQADLLESQVPQHLAFDDPTPGRWVVQASPYGPAVNQHAGLDVRVEGASAEAPGALRIEPRC